MAGTRETIGPLAVICVLLVGSGACSARQAARPSPGHPARELTPAAEPAGTASASPARIRHVLGRYQPLWPFANEADARRWQEEPIPSGRRPWQLDAERTALGFVRHLGLRGVDRVTSRSVRGTDARVTVGYRSAETGETGTAAVLHLVRIGSTADAPWEVVGTDDDDLTLTTPAYGAAVSSPMKVGGRITGVDESVRVEVRQRSSGAVLGRFCCVAAGGSRRAWSAQVPLRDAADPVLIVVASTGGHLAAVERFAVTGVRFSG